MDRDNANFGWRTQANMLYTKWADISLTGFISKARLTPCGTATQIHCVTGRLLMVVALEDQVIDPCPDALNLTASKWQTFVMDPGSTL